MGNLVVRALGVVGAAVLSVATFGSGVASAEELTGQTYDDAAAKISGWNGEAVIGTVSGDQLSTSDCIVASWQKSMFLDSRGRNTRSNEYLLHLNCNNHLASPGQPGNSVMSPQGIQAKKEQQAAANINKDPSYCDQSDAHARSCVQICKRTGLCEI